MMDPRELEAREVLRRLANCLDEAPPDDEEAQEVVAGMGIDLDALAADIRARVDAYELRVAQETAAAAREAVIAQEPPARPLPFVRRKPNGRLVLAAAGLVAAAAGTAVVIDVVAERASALRDRGRSVGQEAAGAVGPIKVPDGGGGRGAR